MGGAHHNHLHTYVSLQGNPLRQRRCCRVASGPILPEDLLNGREVAEPAYN